MAEKEHFCPEAWESFSSLLCLCPKSASKVNRQVMEAMNLRAECDLKLFREIETNASASKRRKWWWCHSFCRFSRKTPLFWYLSFLSNQCHFRWLNRSLKWKTKSFFNWTSAKEFLELDTFLRYFSVQEDKWVIFRALENASSIPSYLRAAIIAKMLSNWTKCSLTQVYCKMSPFALGSRK